MKASFVDLRKKSNEILRALDRNEPVTIFYRGRPKAIMRPVGRADDQKANQSKDHPAFGLWADREEMEDVVAYVRQLRRGRFNDL
jgi:hypothetical protein